jgi:hypothetical protein
MSAATAYPHQDTAPPPKRRRRARPDRNELAEGDKADTGK